MLAKWINFSRSLMNGKKWYEPRNDTNFEKQSGENTTRITKECLNEQIFCCRNRLRWNTVELKFIKLSHSSSKFLRCECGKSFECVQYLESSGRAKTSNKMEKAFILPTIIVPSQASECCERTQVTQRKIVLLTHEFPSEYLHGGSREHTHRVMGAFPR